MFIWKHHPKLTKLDPMKHKHSKIFCLAGKSFVFCTDSLSWITWFSYKMSTICFLHVEKSAGTSQSTPELQQLGSAVVLHKRLGNVFNCFNCILAKWHKLLISFFKVSNSFNVAKNLWADCECPIYDIFKNFLKHIFKGWFIILHLD